MDAVSAARNALHKARQLRDVVVDFTAALESAVEDWRDFITEADDPATTGRQDAGVGSYVSQPADSGAGALVGRNESSR